MLARYELVVRRLDGASVRTDPGAVTTFLNLDHAEATDQALRRHFVALASAAHRERPDPDGAWLAEYALDVRTPGHRSAVLTYRG